MPESSIAQPAKPSQKVSARATSLAGNSTCTMRLPISPPFLLTLYAQPMVRAIVLYDAAPDPDRYAQHVKLCRKVAGAAFRHGRVFGAPMGEPKYGYYAEWEFPDKDTFKAAARSEEFVATGKDAMEMGGRFTVLFADVD